VAQVGGGGSLAVRVDELVPIESAPPIAGVCRSTVYALVAAGTLAAVHRRGRRRTFITRTDLESFRAAHGGG
jgi:Helix-turn-helix domain